MTDSTSLIQQASAAYAALDLDAARDAYSQAVEVSPDDYDAHLGLARTLSRMRKQEEADAAVARCIEIDPERAEGYFAKGVLLFLTDDLDDAQAALDQGIELAPEEPEGYITLSQVLADQNEFDAAEEALSDAREQIAKLSEEDQPAVSAMALHAETYLRLAQGNNDDAVETALEVIELEEANPYAACLAYSNLGILQMRGRKYDLAINYLQEALDLNPYFYRAGHALGRLYIVRKRYAEAVETLQRVVDATSEPSAGVRYALASALSKNGQRKEALAAHRAALAAGLSGINALNARLQIIWLSEVGRYSIIAILMAAVLAYIVLGQPSTQTLTFIALLAVLIVLQRTVGRRRG